MFLYLIHFCLFNNIPAAEININEAKWLNNYTVGREKYFKKPSWHMLANIEGGDPFITTPSSKVKILN